MQKISYIGDGITNQFAFSFVIFQPSDVFVMLNENLLLVNEYSVEQNIESIGGTVTLLNVPTENAKIDIFRKISLSRIIDYQPLAKIEPENLNADFSFLMEYMRDLEIQDVDFAEWKIIHNNVINLINYTNDLITDKIGGGAVLGIYNNLIAVLQNSLPRLINDYGLISESTITENTDDYGTL